MRALLATSRAALTDAAAKRAALIARMTVMVLNDCVWVVFWVLFFRRVESLRGWDVGLMLLLQSTLTTAGGLALGLMSNCRRIGSMAVDGQLDAVLALPTSPLGHLLLRRIDPIFLGDVVFGVSMFVIVGRPTPARVLVFLGVVVCAMAVTVGFLVVVGSLAFFTGRQEPSDLGLNALILLGSYPVDIFAGVVKVLMFTIIPAVFVAAVPARLVADFDAGEAAALVACAAVFTGSAAVLFRLGLRRYTSGAVWTRA